MTNKKPTRASQTKKVIQQKLNHKQKRLRQKFKTKSLDSTIVLRYAQRANGFRHRWVRVEILGFVDTKNIQGRLRSGYELVRADEYPQEDFPAITDGKYAGVIGHGGLVLTRVPEEIARSRQDYFETSARSNDRNRQRSYEGTA